MLTCEAMQDKDLGRQYLSFVQQQALKMRSMDQPPSTLEEWDEQRKKLRQSIIDSMGGFPTKHADLNPRILGITRREGYRVENLVLRTRPGVDMTANAYVPEKPGKHPAVLCVHGHWRLAKSEPVVQSRCIGLAKLGFFVLMVDAFGAGERGLQKALGEYHGEMVAATLWPTGLALSGLQVYENMRAVDYLQTRPEVNGDRIGVTGASGGGNQTMYAGAIDERLKCVVPVCSVGTYQAYLGAACCMCEVVPGALSFTEEAGVLSLVAPRALMLINASRDAFQFSIGEGKKSLDRARAVFELYGKQKNARQATFESKHDYNKAMREAMYGWMTLHLKGEGDGSPIPEPKMTTEKPDVLRAYPGDRRPANFMTLPRFAALTARQLVKQRPSPDHLQMWKMEEMMMRAELPKVLGMPANVPPVNAKETLKSTNKLVQWEVTSEPGISIFAARRPVEKNRQGLAILLDLDRGKKASETSLADQLHQSGWEVVTADLRATGATAYQRDQINRAVDHNTAEWSMWIGRPLLGGWTLDVLQVLNAIKRRDGKLPAKIAVIGQGTASLVALCAAALDSRIDRVATIGGLHSYVSDVPYENQRLGLMVPGILRDVGDVAHIASLAAPRRLLIANSVRGNGKTLSLADMRTSFQWTAAAFKALESEKQIHLLEKPSETEIVEQLA